MAAVTAPRNRRRRSERGAELIELAIVLPLLLLVFAAIVDFGFLFQRYEAVTNAAREGARVAVLPGYGSADVVQRVNNYLAASGLTGSYPAPTVAYSNQLLSGGATVSVATVTVWYPANLSYLGPIASLVGGTQASSIMLKAVSVMRTETPMTGS